MDASCLTREHWLWWLQQATAELRYGRLSGLAVCAYQSSRTQIDPANSVGALALLEDLAAKTLAEEVTVFGSYFVMRTCELLVRTRHPKNQTKSG